MADTPITRAELEREVQHLKELLAVQERAADKALQLQAREYERRLHDLNNAHERAAENWRLSLPRERYEADERSRRAHLFAWVGWLLALAAIVVSFVRH